jgi:5-formyltetrahydrofolate cyclo-ligase
MNFKGGEQKVQMNGSSEKAALRRSLLQQRQAMPTAEWQDKSGQLCEQLRSHPWFVSAKTILAYFSLRQEPDLSSLFAAPKLAAPKVWGFPRCVGQELAWHEWSPVTVQPLERSKFGILEPPPHLPQLSPEAVDLILVPAVACDFRGYRLGYGGGYYDRLLSQPNWIAKPAIGIVFSTAYLPTLPRDSWDLPMNYVCTELGLFSASEGTL